MKISKLVTMLAIVCLFAVAAVAQVTTGTKTTLAVSPVKPTPALEEDSSASTKMSLKRLSDTIKNQLRVFLDKTGKFGVVLMGDDDSTAALLKKLEWDTQSGHVDPKTAAEIRKMTGASHLLIVTVDDYSDSSITIKDYKERLETTYEITVSTAALICDSTTGKIWESGTFQETGKTNSVRTSAIVSGDRGDLVKNEMLNGLGRKLAKQIAQGAVDWIYPAKVTAVTGEYVTINRGEGTGIKKGQVWAIFEIGEEMTDPDTGESLGHQEIPLCEAKVLSVTSKTATLKLLEEDPGVEKGMIVRQVTTKD